MTEAGLVVEARGVTKWFGATTALDQAEAFLHLQGRPPRLVAAQEDLARLCGRPRLCL